MAPGLYDTSTTDWNNAGLSLASPAIPCSLDPLAPCVDTFTLYQPRILGQFSSGSGRGSTDCQLALLWPRELQSTRGRRPVTSSTFTPLGGGLLRSQMTGSWRKSEHSGWQNLDRKKIPTSWSLRERLTGWDFICKCTSSMWCKF